MVVTVMVHKTGAARSTIRRRRRRLLQQSQHPLGGRSRLAMTGPQDGFTSRPRQLSSNVFRQDWCARPGLSDADGQRVAND